MKRNADIYDRIRTIFPPTHPDDRHLRPRLRAAAPLHAERFARRRTARRHPVAKIVQPLGHQQTPLMELVAICSYSTKRTNDARQVAGYTAPADAKNRNRINALLSPGLPSGAAVRRVLNDEHRPRRKRRSGNRACAQYWQVMAHKLPPAPARFGNASGWCDTTVPVRDGGTHPPDSALLEAHHTTLAGDLDRVTRRKLPFQNRLGQRVFELRLDGALQGPRTEHRVEARSGDF